MAAESDITDSSARRMGWVQRDMAAVLGLALAFFLLATLGIQLTRQAGNIALFWPANAVAVAFLLRHKLPVWPVGLMLIFAANVAANLLYGDELLFAAKLSCANAAEIATCVLLFKKLDLQSFRDNDPGTLYRFVWYVAVASTAGAIIGGSTIAYAFDAPLLRMLLTWWIVDFVSLVLLLCPILARPPMVSRETVRTALAEDLSGRSLEFIAAGALTFVAVAVLASVGMTIVLGFSPLLLWVALRYGVFVTGLVAAVIGLGFVLLASGARPLAFLELTITPQSVVGVQTALIFISVPALLVSAVVRALDVSRAQLEEKRAELLRSNKGLKEFTFIASHDLQEPLRKISSSASIVREDYADKIDQDGQHLLKIMADAATDMRSLIVDLLEYARIENADIKHEDVDLGAVLTRVTANIDNSVPDTGARIDLVGLPHVWADARQVEQLFQNLVENALKYRHPQRKPEISVKFQPAAPNDHYAHLELSDNGIGFEDAYAETIFEPFRRLHSRSEISGSGIGLSICRAVCERQGWQISASATDGEGAVFTIKIPRGSIVVA